MQTPTTKNGIRPVYAQCTQCADLCCVAYAFDAGHGFGVSKAANDPCPNLKSCKGCSIHTDLKSRHFDGCIQYDCHGAGVRVTQELFGGADWRTDPTLLAPMSDALRVLAPAHEKANLLFLASKMDLPEDALKQCLALRDALLTATLEAAPALCKQADALLRSLAGYV